MDINRPIKSTDYNISAIVDYSISMGIDITPDSERDWKMFCHACKIMGISEISFVALSRIHGTTDRASRNAYRYAKRNYFTPEQSAQKILHFASQAGIKIYDFLPDDKKSELRAYLRKQETTAQSRRMERLKSILRHEPTTATPAKDIPGTDTPGTPTEETAPPVYLSPALIDQAESLLERTTFYNFLLSEFGTDILTTLRAYHVGGCKWEYWREKQVTNFGLATAFPIIDQAGNLHDFQLSPFAPDGHGIKEPTDPKRKIKSWALARMKQSDHRPGWAFFGEHLLADRPTAPVAIVEAPKTAIIASYYYPEFVWLSCLSMQWINTAISVEPLRNRVVWLFPDRDGAEAWSDKAKELKSIGIDAGLSDFMEHHPGEPKDDIADILLRLNHGEQPTPPEDAEKSDTRLSPDKAEAYKVFEEIKRKYPAWIKIAEELQLEPIRVEPLKTENE